MGLIKAIKKGLYAVADVLNFVLPRQTGYVPPAPLEFVTRMGLRFATDDPTVRHVVADDVITDGGAFSVDLVRLQYALESDRVGYRAGDLVTIVVDSGEGLVLYRAKVEPKEGGK